MKTCAVCGESKPLDQYSKHPRSRDRLQARCKPCDARYARERTLRVKYGLTPEEYAQMLEDCGGLCAICLDRMDPVCVDHDHATGKVRGLLCMPCNAILGWYGENSSRLRRAADYLER